ncbi:MAG: hypothetical protein Q7N50_12415 [Armatimonadota bacterium]|nr:hypothetical protein [Armatimonadota bacterium]
MNKIKRLHVIIIGSVACAIVGVGMFFLLIKPINQEIKTVDDQLQASQAVGVRLDSANRGLADAISQVSMAQSKLARYEATKMPNLSFAQRDTGMIDLWREQSEVLGPILQRWGYRGGVSLASSIAVPPAPTNPNAIDTSLIRIPIGHIEVVGDFRSILSHIRAWNTCPRLVQIDKPSLSGADSNLKASYDVTVYIFPKGAAGPAITMAGGEGGAAGAPGAPATPAAPSAPAGGGSSTMPTSRYGMTGT